MILLENIDSKIWHIETKVVDMVKEYQDQGKLIISLNSEGPCCEALGLYKILDHMCEKFNIDKTNITIETGNQLESHQFYNINVVQQVKWTLERVATHLKDWQLESKTDTLKHCGILIGRGNSFRLWLASWVRKNHSDKTVMSYHFDRTNDSHYSHIGFNGMIRAHAYEAELNNALDLLAEAPIKLDQIDEYPVIDPANLNIIKEYKNFFLDIVMETYFSNNTFFLSEKICRPIISQTPFIVFASPGWLGNLKKLGFKTFDRWWSEEYDDYGEEVRISKMQLILKDIYSKSTNELLAMIKDMEPVLKHNRELILTYAKQR